MEVQRAVAKIGSGPMRGAEVGGRGAAGDRTLVADRLAEEVLAKALLGVGGVKVLSEEAGDIGDKTSPILAVVDPLDGSSNFERGIQFYCTSVAVEGGKKREMTMGRRLEGIRVAMVRNLVNGDAYFAVRGKGATKNGKKITTSSSSSSSSSGERTSSSGAAGTTAPSLGEAVLAIDQGGCSGEVLRALSPLVSRAKRVVHFGANALELCLLAEGTVDAFVDLRGRMRITDIAGGYLIAKEAGAQIALASNWSPGSRESHDARHSPAELSLEPRFSMVASASPSIHSAIMEELRQAHISLQSR